MSSTFKIIIVGGGIAGLALANMLEKFDIDYVLIEARDEIASKEGAAIGLMPNGSLILEQLGLFEAVRAAAPDAEIRDSHIRESTGKSIISLKHMMYHQEIRCTSSQYRECGLSINQYLDTDIPCSFLIERLS
jgi:2-polyprenyl-6-methoxyphenol hydroxylase-like FAD-dependent oxidoreductase